MDPEKKKDPKPKPEKRHVCRTCGKTFERPNHLREHIQRVHEGKYLQFIFVHTSYYVIIN